jgi:predicted NAD-dependent protein-ADP-ribosyltransferase YbiA (DUF1768 family)
MSAVIKLYKPSDKPFGHLSNNWRDPLRIDGTVWPTVTNYILANMLRTPLYRSVIQNARVDPIKKDTNIDDKAKQLITNIQNRQGYVLSANERAAVYRQVVSRVQISRMNIYELYNMYLQMEYFNTVRTAAEQAYNVRFTKDPFVQTLLETGNLPIEYASANSILGTGSDGKGQNVIGKVLMQIRWNLSRQKREEERQEQEQTQRDRIYTVYLASEILKKAYRDGHDIKKYMGKSAEKIVEIYKGEHDMAYVYSSLRTDPQNKDMIVQRYDRGHFPEFRGELESPGALSLAIRKAELRNVAGNRKEQQKNLVFNMYVKYYAIKEKPELEGDDEKLNQVVAELVRQAPSLREYHSVKSRVYDLFKVGELSERLSDQIDLELKNITVPSDEEIAEAESSVSHPPSGAEIPEEHRTTSSSQEEDPLKLLLSGHTSEKAQKKFVVQQLQKYSGKSWKFYQRKNYSLGKLEQLLAAAKSSGAPPVKGYEIQARKVQLTVDRDKMDVLTTKLERFMGDGFREAFTKGGRVMSMKDVARAYSKIVQDLPRGGEGKLKSVWLLEKKEARFGGTYALEEEQGSKGEIVRKRVWVPDPAMIERSVHFPGNREELEDVQEIPGRFVPSHGKAIRIFPDPSANEVKLAPFSPLYMDPLEISQVTYPNVSLYITTQLLATTGQNIKTRQGDVGFSRGMGITKALALLRPERAFKSATVADQIYLQQNKNAHFSLEKNFLKTAINAKFKNRNLQDLLLMTLDARIEWTDPNDLLLGVGTRKQPGENEVGKVLMAKRAELKEAYTPGPTISLHNVAQFIQKDPFMSGWVRMRLEDMCKVVYLVKNYMFVQANIDERIDARFATTVLDTIYQPCNYMRSMIPREQRVEVPKIFTMMVKSKVCKEMQFVSKNSYALTQQVSPFRKLDPNIRELLEETGELEMEERRTMVSADDMINHYKTQIANINLTAERGVRTINRNSEEVRVFEQKQQENWSEFLKSLDKPRLSPEDIQSGLDALDREQREQLRLKKGKRGYVALKRRLKRERDMKVGDLHRPAIQDKPAALNEFAEQQRAEADEFFGIDRSRETSEEKAARLQQVKVLTTEISKLRNAKKKELLRYNVLIQDITKVYWVRIAIMVHFLIEHMTQNNVDPLKIKTVIAQVVMLNSTPMNCKRILDDEKDNCIASALLNILHGLGKFKHEYAENIPLGNPDIELAASIILNRDTSDTLVEEEGEVPEERELLFGEEDVSSSPEDDAGQYGDLPSDEAVMAFPGKRKRKKKKRVEQIGSLDIIKNELRMVDHRKQATDLTALARFFLGTITMIKAFPMADKIKTNRINFFATIR